jgi:hypothetical protein
LFSARQLPNRPQVSQNTEQNVDLYISMLHAGLGFIDSFAPRPSFGNPGGSFQFSEFSSGLNRFDPISRIQIFEVNWDA